MTRFHLLVAGSAFAAAFSSAAQAQDAPPAESAQDAAVAASEQAAAEEEVIVVTAQLRQQNLVEVPLTITAYNGEFLERLGIVEFEELSRYVPGFEVQNQSPNNPGFVIRGITSDTGVAFNEPRVSVFQDGVSISKSRGSYVELMDMERVEVVKGPQSTLYGRGALIGGVNLIQNKARVDRAEGFAKIGTGNLDYFIAEGMANVPLGGAAALRVAGRYRSRDGYITNLLGGEDFNSIDTGAVRGALRIEPSERFTVDLIANYQEDHPAGTSFKSMMFNPTDPTTGAVLGTREPWTGAALSAPATFEGGELGLDRSVWGVTGLVGAELSDSVKLTSITAYRKFDSVEVFDVDGISLPAVAAVEDASGKQFSQEVRVTFDNQGPLSGFVGASFFHDSGFQRTPAIFDERIILARATGMLHGPAILGRPVTDPAPLAVFGNTAFTAPLLQGLAAAYGYALPAPIAAGIAANLKPAHLETATNFAKTTSVDLFGDVTFEVSPGFEIGAGLRYTHDDKESRVSAAVLNGRSILAGVLGALGQAEPTRTALLTALAAPGAATIPFSAFYPVPLFGLSSQPTANNGDVVGQKLKDDGFTWRLNARYEIDPSTSLFASYARGRRPEVLSATPPATPGGPARFDRVDAETVDSFEVGARRQARGLLLDGTLFYYKYNNFQSTEQQGTLLVVTNAGEAESYGFEGQVRYRPVALLDLFANYAFNHSRFLTGIREGNRMRLSPDHKFSFGGTLTAPVGPGRIDFTPTLTYQSKVFFDDDNDRPDLQTVARGALVPDLVQDEVQDGYALVNARLGYEFGQGVRLEAFVNNLFDKEYIKDAGNTGDFAGMPTFIAGEPRIYGVQASVRF